MGLSCCEFTCTAVTITSTICTIILVKLHYFCFCTGTFVHLSHIPTGKQTVRYCVYVLKLRQIWNISLLLRGVPFHLYSFPKLNLSYRSSWNEVCLSAPCAVGSECVSVNRSTFRWEFCSKIEWRLTFVNILYGILSQLLFKRLIQTTKRKCKSLDHFSNFLITGVYESGTRNATRSTWHVIRNLVFLPFHFFLCNLSTFQHHIQPTQIISQDVHFNPTSPHKTAHSNPNPYIVFISLAPSICLYTSRTWKQSLSDCADQF